MMNVLSIPSERFVQIDSIINFGNLAPCVPAERFSIRTISTHECLPRQADALLQYKHYLNI
jgi:hypothetical protein